MRKYGDCEGYNGNACSQCGRVRVEHYSGGFDICEKCLWCEQLNNYVDEDDLYDDIEEYGSWMHE